MPGAPSTVQMLEAAEIARVSAANLQDEFAEIVTTPEAVFLIDKQ